MRKKWKFLSRGDKTLRKLENKLWYGISFSFFLDLHRILTFLRLATGLIGKEVGLIDLP